MTIVWGMHDVKLFIEMLNIDSTSSKEKELSSFLAERFVSDDCEVQRFDVGDGTENLLFSWGKPDIVFCSHLDTVPPYFTEDLKILPDDVIISGRGTCDAKGQIFAMYLACKELASQGKRGFGLLLLSGEETGSFGAKAFRNQHPGGRYVIVGEPTDNCMASASKGTKSFELTFTGKAFHSGYPQYGESAVMYFNEFLNALGGYAFPIDDVLGETTWNIGKLVSDNPQNIMSDNLTCRLYFRTTFASDAIVADLMDNIVGDNAKYKFGTGSVAQWQKRLDVKALGGDTPMKYITLDGFPTKAVSFGSDAPQLTNFENKILCGPGSVLVAHRYDENIRLSDINKAVEQYVKMFDVLSANNK